MSPAPTARARPSPICARSSKPQACASTSTPRPIWCGSTNAIASAAAVAACWSSDDELCAALEHCEHANAGAPITMFEIETAAAFCLFAQHPADVVLLEVGLGGRLDADQRDRRAASRAVIAPVSMDHTEFLGDTLAAIAGEKAAIIKRSVPVVCAEQVPEAMAVIEAQARPHARAAACGRAAMACQRRARPAGLSGRARPDGSGGAKDCSAGISSTMPGWRSRPCARSMRSGSTCAAFEAGIVNAEWPARMQRLVVGQAGRARGRRVAKSGSTAATMPRAGASPPPRSAISKSGCRARWW